MNLAYCDYIASKIQTALRFDSRLDDTLLHFVDSVQMDLHPEEGYFQSTKKTIRVQDKGGKYYTVTIEEE